MLFLWDRPFFPYVYTDGLYWWFWAQIFLFFLFLAIYLFTLLGNVRLMLIVIGDSLPHNPMYSFLSALSFLDVCCSSVVTPKLVINFLSENKDISYLEKKSGHSFFFSLKSHFWSVHQFHFFSHHLEPDTSSPISIWTFKPKSLTHNPTASPFHPHFFLSWKSKGHKWDYLS